MQIEATIYGTREGCYLACIDAEREAYHCDEECLKCPYPCRIILKKEQPIEKGRRVLVELEESLIRTPEKLIPILGGIYIACFVIMMIVRKIFLNYYRSFWPVILSGFFASASFYLVLKLIDEKKGGGEELRKGRIIRVYPPNKKKNTIE